MKKIFITLLTLSTLLFLNVKTFAQKKQNFVPEKGHWQLVSNKKDKKTITVLFYNDQNQLIYQETLNNTRMNPNRVKVRRQLYYALQDACNQWALYQRITPKDLIAKRK